jgi:tetratricopeptide (TPR) repeat protein
MQATIQHVGHDIICKAPGSASEEIRISGAALLPQLLDWAARYESALRKNDADAFFPLGRDIFTALDQAQGWAQAWCDGSGPRRLEIRVDSAESPFAQALLAAPWELLSTKKAYLVDDDAQPFELTRRIGKPQPPTPPKHADLQLMFMAAAPVGEHELDFEAEESAILKATERLHLHLAVEESGAADILAERLASDGPFEALHLSCHGNIDPTHGPYLAFENETGGMKPAFVGDVVNLLGNTDHTPLVFLSACHTAVRQVDASVESFARELVRAGAHNVLGWDGSVKDADAAVFSQAFYRELALFKEVPQATALARRALRQQNRGDPEQGRHWHLARLYLGTQGGGALASNNMTKRNPASTAHINQFLDAQRLVPVASRTAFVGRRRTLQTVLRAFANGHEGVLIHGMGNLGKSSLAHRVGTRKTSLRQVVVFKSYDALAIFDRLISALPGAQRDGLIETWRSVIADKASALGDVLEDLLQGVFHQQPILLVIDDLEQILEQPGHSDIAATPVQPAFRPALLAVLRSFARVNTDSRLLITSRYKFNLFDATGRDLAAGLTAVPLLPMPELERDKQMRAATTASQLEHVDQTLLSRALKVAGGNPGLQATLTKPLFAEEVEVAEQAIAVIEIFQSTGVVPESLTSLQTQGFNQADGNALMDYFNRMAFGTYRAALTADQARMLAIASFFTANLPIPTSALEACGENLGLSKSSSVIKRLLALGMLDDWGGDDANRAVSANPLARPLVPALSSQEQASAAQSAVQVLDESWRDAKGEVHWDERGVELNRLVLLTSNLDMSLLDQTATASALHYFRTKNYPAQAMREALQPAINRLNKLNATPRMALARITFDCAELTGDITLQRNAVSVLSNGIDTDIFDAGSTSLRLARAFRKMGEIAKAEVHFEKAASHFKSEDRTRDWALARGGIAEIHLTHGNVDEALRIRNEEQLPLFMKLGDVRSVAVTWGEVADIHRARGELVDALRIRIEEQLPAYESLGDTYSAAVTWDKIAEIYKASGQPEKSLAIHERLLPVLIEAKNKIGEARSKYSIAHIWLVRGVRNLAQFEALYGYLECAFTIIVDSDLTDSIATMGFSFAGVLAMSGERARALEVLKASKAAFDQLLNVQEIEACERLRCQIEGGVLSAVKWPT